MQASGQRPLALSKRHSRRCNVRGGELQQTHRAGRVWRTVSRCLAESSVQEISNCGRRTESQHTPQNAAMRSVAAAPAAPGQAYVLVSARALPSLCAGRQQRAGAGAAAGQFSWSLPRPVCAPACLAAVSTRRQNESGAPVCTWRLDRSGNTWSVSGLLRSVSFLLWLGRGHGHGGGGGRALQCLDLCQDGLQRPGRLLQRVTGLGGWALRRALLACTRTGW